jgi:hypothetical protein
VRTGKQEPVYLHLECDDFKPDLMYFESEDKGYQQWRMCPHGQVKFFFSIEGKPLLSNKYPTMQDKFKRKALCSV